MNLLRYYMTEIEQGLDALCSLVRQSAQPAMSVMFALPPISKEDEAKIIEDDYETIPVTPLYGQRAIEYALEAFKDMYVFDNNMSRRFVQKYPGLIALSCSWHAVTEIVEKINLAKNNFRQEVQKYEGAEEKFYGVHDRFNYLITTMAYRHIFAFRGDYKGFYFNWSRRCRSETRSADEWILRLDKARYTIPANHTQVSWNALIDSEQQQIAACGAQKLSMRRPNKLRPECSVRDADGAMQGRSASLPFLIAEHTNKPNVTMLKDYCKKAEPASSSNWQLVAARPRLYMKL